MHFLRHCLALLCLLLCHCSEPAAAVPEATAAPARPTTLAGAVVDTVAADQIEYTAARNPELLTANPEQPSLPPPAAPKPVVAPPPPTNFSPAAPPSPAPTEAPAPSSTAPDHSPWNGLLQRHVDGNGRVDYGGFAREQAALDRYLATLAERTPEDDWTREERLAYWINAYNAYTIKLILDHQPVQSIRDIDQPWERKWITLGGKSYSLNNIEHDIIRQRFNEPRVHFALVCAAKSCPPLPNEAFTAQNLNTLLQQRTRRFINDERFNVTQEAVVRVSPLFDWYGEDFGEVREYLNDYLATDIPEGKEISFLDYDWSLNN